MVGVVKNKEEEGRVNKEVESNKKRGRGSKKGKEEYRLNRERSKFIVDLGRDKNDLELVYKLLTEANKKDYGKEITYKELASFAMRKINSKDIEKIQEQSMSEMEKVERTLNEYNSKNKTKLSLGEFLVKKLNIN